MLFISSSVFACEKPYLEQSRAVIEVLCQEDQTTKQDILDSKNNESVIQGMQRNEGLSINLRKISSAIDINQNHLFNVISTQFENMLNYIYTLSYLSNRSKVIFSTISSEILPNAP